MKKLLIMISALIMTVTTSIGLAACDLFGGGNSGEGTGNGSQTGTPGGNGGQTETPGGNGGTSHTHSYVIAIEQPTESKTGKVTEKCSCGDAKPDIILPVLTSGQYGKTSDTATCNKGGMVEYNIKIDGATYKFQVLTPATGKHIYVDGTCICGAADPNYVPHTHTYTLNKCDASAHWQECACGAKTNVTLHNWDAGTVTKQANCNEEGEKTFTCGVCKHTKTESIPVSPNAHEYRIKSINAVSHELTCKYCNRKQTEEHNFVKGVCTECKHDVGTEVGLFRYAINTVARANTATVLGFAGDPVANVVIPANVTIGGVNYTVVAIGESAFTGEWDIVTVQLPETIVRIEKDSFRDTKLNEINFPASLKIIGDGAFFGWNAQLINGLNVTLPATIDEIGARAFANSNIRVAVVHAAIIGEYAFEGCDELEDVTLGASVENVGKGAFLRTGLVKVRIEAGIKVTVFFAETFSRDVGSGTIGMHFDFYGTRAQWDAIQKDAGWQKGVNDANETYSLAVMVGTGHMQDWNVVNGVET